MTRFQVGDRVRVVRRCVWQGWEGVIVETPPGYPVPRAVMSRAFGRTGVTIDYVPLWPYGEDVELVPEQEDAQ